MPLTDIIERLMRGSHDRSARIYLSQVDDYFSRYRHQVDQSLDKVAKRAGSKIFLGETSWGKKIYVPAKDFLATHGLILGATGSGKSYYVLNLLQQILKSPDQQMGLGILDPKGELFQKSLQYISAFLSQADTETQNRFKKRLHIIDFADDKSIVPYHMLKRRNGESLELLVANRLDSICELFDHTSSLTARMQLTLKYLLLLLAEYDLPIVLFERLCDDDELLFALANSSRNERVKRYFRTRFKAEAKSTLLALRQRIDRIMASESVRLSLSAATVPDFRRLMDSGAIILINTAGPQIAKGTSLLLQLMMLSDIRQAVFQRQQCQKPFIWFLDEAQWFYRHRSSKDNISDLLCMARSYGSFLWLITQSLTSAIRDSEIRNTLECNVRNILMLRSTAEDGRLLLPAMPVTGTMPAPKRHPLEPVKLMSTKEEIKARLEELPRLADRSGYLWLRLQLDRALKIKTPLIPEPEEQVKEGVDWKEELKKIKQSIGVSPERIRRDLQKKEESLIARIPVRNYETAVLPKKTADETSMLKLLEKQYQRKKGNNGS